MNFIAECEVTISKKLQKIFEESEPVSIYIDPIKKNKAKAHFRFVAQNGVNEKVIKESGETSLIFRFNEVAPDIPDFDSGREPLQSIFVSDAEVVDTESRVSAKNELDITERLTSGTEVRQAKAKEMLHAEGHKPLHSSAQSTVPLPESLSPFPTVKITKGDKSIRITIDSYQNLMKVLQCVPGINKDLPKIDETKKLDRRSALTYEKQLRQLPKLPFSLYVRNIRGGQLEIQDLDLIMKHDEVIDISQIAAHKLLTSRDVRICMEHEFVRIVTRQEYDAWRENLQIQIETTPHEARAITGSSLDVYGSIDEAADEMFRGGHEANIDESGPSKFIDTKETTASAKVPLRRTGETPTGVPIDFTTELVDSNVNYDVDDPSKWISPELEGLVQTIPDEIEGRVPLPKISHLPSKTHSPIQKVS